MMTNPYFNPSGNPGTGAEGLSALMRGEFAAIGAGFDLMPQITTSGSFSTTFVPQGNYTFTLPASPGTLALASDVATAQTVVTNLVGAEAGRAVTAEGVLTTAVSTEATARATADALLAPKLIPTITGLHETAIAMAANNIDCNAATIFTKTISGITTLTVSNVPASGISASFILELTNGGSAAVTWWAGVKWAGGGAPTLTVAGVDVLGFYTINGGTAWRGLLLGKGMA